MVIYSFIIVGARDAEQLRTLQVTEKRKIGPAVIKSLKQYLC